MFTKLIMAACCGILWLGISGVQAATPMAAAGGSHSLALASDGNLYGWGVDNFGQVGAGRLIQSKFPVKVDGTTVNRSTPVTAITPIRNPTSPPRTAGFMC